MQAHDNKAPEGGTVGAAVDGLTKLLGQQQPEYSSLPILTAEVFKPLPSLRQLVDLALHEEARPVSAAKIARKIGASPVAVESALDRLYSDVKCERYSSDGQHYYYISRRSR